MPIGYRDDGPRLEIARIAFSPPRDGLNGYGPAGMGLPYQRTWVLGYYLTPYFMQ
jgi:hypothetical protein